MLGLLVKLTQVPLSLAQEAFLTALIKIEYSCDWTVLNSSWMLRLDQIKSVQMLVQKSILFVLFKFHIRIFLLLKKFFKELWVQLSLLFFGYLAKMLILIFQKHLAVSLYLWGVKSPVLWLESIIKVRFIMSKVSPFSRMFKKGWSLSMQGTSWPCHKEPIYVNVLRLECLFMLFQIKYCRERGVSMNSYILWFFRLKNFLLLF